MTDQPPARRNFSTQVSPDIQERVRATVRGVSLVTGSDYSLAAFVEDALEDYCARLEHRYNNGEPWLRTATPLRPGRRLTGMIPPESLSADEPGQATNAAAE